MERSFTTLNADNQLATLYNLVDMVLTLKIKQLTGIIEKDLKIEAKAVTEEKHNLPDLNNAVQGKTHNLKITEKTFDNKKISIIDGFLKQEQAVNIRHFIFSVKEEGEQLNDLNNQPHDYAFNTLGFIVSSSGMTPDKIDRHLDSNFSPTDKTYNYNPSGWMWERYRHDIYRLRPKSLNAFYHSPIYNLIKIIDEKLMGLHPDANKKVCWVIQRLDRGMEMRPHIDGGGRKYSFIYYLTPSGWDPKTDGGELIIMKDPDDSNLYDNSKTSSYVNKNYILGENDEMVINPTFNRLVLWKNDEGEAPLHRINMSKRDSRIALVGFYW